MQEILGLFSNAGNITWQMVAMWIIGGVLIYLGIVKKMEPSLLVPMGFGAVLVNLPMSAVPAGADGIRRRAGQSADVGSRYADDQRGGDRRAAGHTV